MTISTLSRGSKPTASARPNGKPTRATSGRVVTALASGVLAFSLMQTLLVPALPSLYKAFGVDPATGGWILTAYLLAGAVTSPVLGNLGDRFGHKRLLVVSIMIFIVGTVVALCATAFPVLLLGRVLQGASMATFPLSLALVRHHVEPERQRAAIGLLSGTLGLGAGIALAIGGLIDTLLSWQWLFVVGLLLGALSAVLIAVWTPTRSVTPVTGRTDFTGISLLSVGLVALLLAVSQGTAWGWGSPAVVSLIVVAVVTLVALVLIERRVSQPLVDVRALARPAVALTSVITVFLGLVPYLFYVGLPILLERHTGIGHGLSTLGTGFALLPCALLVFVGGRLVPWLLKRLPASGVAALAMGLMMVGSIGVALLPTSLIAVILFFSLIGLGNGIGFAVTSDLISRSVPSTEIAAAVGVNGVLRIVGSSFGAPLTALMITSHGVTVQAFQWLFFSAAGMSLVAAVVGLFIRGRATK